MISEMFRIASTTTVGSLALSFAAGAMAESRIRPCSNASLRGTYGFLHDGTDSYGTPATAAASQVTFDSTAGTFTGETTASHDGVIANEPLTGTYEIASNCTGIGTPTGGSPFSIVVTPTGFFAVHPLSEGFAVEQGSPTCTNAGVTGMFGFETTGVFLAGPATGAVALIGELKLTVDPYGEGVISGHMAGAEGSTITFAEEPITGSYKINRNYRGTATITPKGRPEMHFSLVVVDSGNKMLAIETDADTVVSGTLVKGNQVISHADESIGSECKQIESPVHKSASDPRSPRRALSPRSPFLAKFRRADQRLGTANPAQGHLSKGAYFPESTKRGLNAQNYLFV